MPSLIHNSKSNYRRPGSPVDTQNHIVGVSVGERRETRAATPLVFSNFRSVWQRERLAHVERMHMATPPPPPAPPAPAIPPPLTCIYGKKEGSLYTKVPLASHVTNSPVQSRVEYMSKILHNSQYDLFVNREGRPAVYAQAAVQRLVVFTGGIHTFTC